MSPFEPLVSLLSSVLVSLAAIVGGSLPSSTLPIPDEPGLSEPSVITFDMIDLNSDGLIDREELSALLVSDDPSADAFDFLDLDGDGAISPFEFAAMAFEVE